MGMWEREKPQKSTLVQAIEANPVPKEVETKGVPGEEVNHPAHYNTGNIEVIDAIEDWGLGFHAGNVVKYVARYKHKGGLKDLKKAQWYLNRLVEHETLVSIIKEQLESKGEDKACQTNESSCLTTDTFSTLNTGGQTSESSNPPA